MKKKKQTNQQTNTQKYCENCKTKPWDHEIGCQITLSKSTKKVKKKKKKVAVVTAVTVVVTVVRQITQPLKKSFFSSALLEAAIWHI